MFSIFEAGRGPLIEIAGILPGEALADKLLRECPKGTCTPSADVVKLERTERGGGE
jgi:hypothetical protein